MAKRIDQGSTRKSAPPIGLHTVDQGGFRDLMARAAVLEAERAVEGAAAFLEQVGIIKKGKKPGPMPLDFVLKLAACLRISQWENAGLAHRLEPSLPTFGEAWEDLITAPRTGCEKFPGLAARVFETKMRHMAWNSPTTSSDIEISSVSPSNVVDELAEILFQFRHLVDQHRPSGPEENEDV